MIKSFNRRDWLKSSLLLAGGLVTTPTLAIQENTFKVATPSSLLREYLPDFPIDESRILARLNANENPYGPSPEVIQAIADSISQGNRYGHGDAATLIRMIAEKEGVSEECVMLGPGSTDLLEKVAITRFQHGGNIVSADPSYMSVMNTAQDG